MFTISVKQVKLLFCIIVHRYFDYCTAWGNYKASEVTESCSVDSNASQL